MDIAKKNAHFSRKSRLISKDRKKKLHFSRKCGRLFIFEKENTHVTKKKRIGLVLLITLGSMFLFHSFQQKRLLNTLSNTFQAAFSAGPKGTSEQTGKQENSYTGTWEDWIDEQTGIMLEAVKKHGVKVSEEYAKGVRSEVQAAATNLKKDLSTPPPLMYDVKVTQTSPAVKKTVVTVLEEILPPKHEGPQTPEVLMDSFDEEYSRVNPNANAIDQRYPRAEWLAMLLESGHIIEDSSQYSVYLNLRHRVAQMENDSAKWDFKYVGISATNDFEAYKNAFIDRKAWEMKRIEDAETADPTINGGYFPHSHPDVFLPFKDKRVYVRRNGRRTSYFGEVLSEEQQFNLVHRGIHPEGMEIIYIDNDYNVLSDRPPTITREDILNFGGSLPRPEFEEGKTDWTQEEHPQRFNDSLYEELPEAKDAAVRTPETFQKQVVQTLRDALEQTTKSDAETDAEIEKQFTPESPQSPTEESLESSFREQFAPERLNQAMATLNRYGPKEGLRRLRKADPEVAERLERLLSRKRSTRDTRQ